MIRKRLGIPPISYHGLMDAETNAVIYLSSQLTLVNFLQECIPDTYAMQNVNRADQRDFFLLAHLPPEKHAEWAWNHKASQLQKSNPALITERIRTKSRLARKKADLTESVIFHINIARSAVRKDIVFQETVYITKRDQAQRFKDRGYDETQAIEYPYVLQYADYRNIPLKQAADDILFKAKLRDDLMAKTELLRIMYFNKIKDANNAEELPLLYSEFLKDCYTNASI